MCQNCNQNNCGECTEATTICNQCQSEETTCDCAVILSSDCINYDQDSILYGETVVVPKNTILSVALDNIVQFFKVELEAVKKFLRIVNTGTGASIYSGMNLLGEKKLRKLNSTSSIVTITENTDDISVGLNTAVLDTFIEANQKTYSATNIGTGASIYKNTNVVGNNTQFNVRKIKSSNSSVTITEGVNDIDLTVVVPNGSETKVNAGTSVTITGNGTIETPYVVNSQYAPFERINEGNGNGYAIRGRNPTYYGNIGLNAVDLSYSENTSTAFGATGEQAFAKGWDVIASAYGATVFGEDLNNNGNLSTIFGKGGVITNGYANFITGGFNEVTSGAYATVIGQFADAVVNNIANVNEGTNTMFAVGNGTATGAGLPLARSTALRVLQNGIIEAPSLSIAEIDAGTNKTLITKEYLTDALSTTNIQTTTITYNSPSTSTSYNVSTGLHGGATLISVTAFLECISDTGGYVVGDIVTGQTPEARDSGGLSDSGIGVKFRANTPTEVVFSINNTLDINHAYSGSVGTSTAIGIPSRTTNLTPWAIKLVILYTQ